MPGILKRWLSLVIATGLEEQEAQEESPEPLGNFSIKCLNLDNQVPKSSFEIHLMQHEIEESLSISPPNLVEPFPDIQQHTCLWGG